MIRPLDLQVSINSMIETSRDQAAKQATLLQEQRTIDGHIIDDAKLKEHRVNQTDKTEPSPKLEDTEKHFGNKTEAELEEEHSHEDKTKKEKPESKEKEVPENQKKPDSIHHIDTLV